MAPKKILWMVHKEGYGVNQRETASGRLSKISVT
jgi:hypothetical protein